MVICTLLFAFGMSFLPFCLTERDANIRKILNFVTTMPVKLPESPAMNRTELLPDRPGVPPMAELPEPEILDIPALFAACASGETDLVCVLGPTASGKTRYAVELARAFNRLAGRPVAEILSGDSRQVYRGMDLGTGKDLDEYGEIPYHLIDIADAGTRYDIYQFQQDFETAYQDIRSRGGIPILCGGSGLYIEEGDKAEDVTERYGASLYIEPTNRYLIEATSEKAFTASENRYIHLGERVHLRCVTDGSHKGTGMVAALTEKGFNIEVTGGDFYMGEKVDIYRKEDYSKESCVGRGVVGRAKPVAVKGAGSVLKIHVKNGDFVERGELLFETVEGVLDGLYAPDNQVLSPVTGIVASVEKKNGESIGKGDTLMNVMPASSLQVEFDVPEADLFTLQEGQKVSMELYWETENGKTYSGEIVSIAHVNTEQKTETDRKTYKAYATINADERIRAGMSVILYVEGAKEPAAEGHEAE